MQTIRFDAGAVLKGTRPLFVVVASDGRKPSLESAVEADLLPRLVVDRLLSTGLVKLGKNVWMAPDAAETRTVVLVEAAVSEPGSAKAPTRGKKATGGNGAARPAPRELCATLPLGYATPAFITGAALPTDRWRLAGAELFGTLRTMDLTEADVAILAGAHGATFTGAVLEGLTLASYTFDRFRGDKTSSKDRHLIVASLLSPKELANQVGRARVIGESVAYARDLVNTPPNELGPLELERAALTLAKELKIKGKSYDVAQMTRKGMGALLGVAQGSRKPARLIELEYKPARPKCRVALVGKGVTFDAGGISLKGAAGMELMKMDMGGAGAVLGALRSIVQLRLPVHLMVLIPAVENMPDGQAQRPGDVVKAASGKTIEVTNTDAEGRLILADALHHAESFDPDVIIDIATLTGEAGRTFGPVISPVLGNDWKWVQRMIAAGVTTHERVWPLPILEEYRQTMQGDVADLKNSAQISGYSAGSILGASFLREFVTDRPWIHLDVANTAWVSADSGYKKKGATGVGVRLLERFIEDLAV